MRNSGAEAWAESIFGGAILGDKRLEKRLVRIGAGVARSPAGTITAALGSDDKWAEAEGAFRFVENSRVDPEAVFEAVGSSTAASLETGSRCFVAIDQTELTFTDRKRIRGLGPANNKNISYVRGLQVMSALALDGSGVPVGLLDQQWWSRSERLSPHYSIDKRPAEERESCLWNRSLRACAMRLADTGTRPWFVMDRGADFWAVLHEAVDQELLVTVRAHHNRVIQRNSKRMKLKSTVARQPVLGETQIRIPKSAKRRGRVATFEIRALKCTLVLGSKKRPTKLSCVRLRETSRVPAKEKPVEWLLLTTHEVSDFASALEVVESYRFRWRVEEFHKTWKSGACNVEASQLRSLDALRRWATILAAVATRVERLKLLSRETPDVDALTEFTQDELDAAIMLSKSKKAPKLGEFVTLNAAVRMVARFGGYPDRKSDGPPGSITIRRGLERILPAAAVLKATRESG